MCAPHTSSAALSDEVNVTIMSPVLFPPTGPLWTGTVMLVIVPPYSRRLRDTPANVCAPATDSPAWVGEPGVKGSDGNACESGAGRLGHIDETAPPPLAHSPGFSVTL